MKIHPYHLTFWTNYKLLCDAESSEFKFSLFANQQYNVLQLVLMFPPSLPPTWPPIIKIIFIAPWKIIHFVIDLLAFCK